MKNVLDNILEQHKSLKAVLVSIEKLLDTNKNSSVILGLLEKFFSELKAHLKLENDVFYPELLEKMAKKGLDTMETKKFIAEMREIEGELSVFWSKNNQAEDIENDFEDFKKDFLSVKEAVFLRIDSEEDGVFIYY